MIKIEVQTNDEDPESLETPEPLAGQVEEHGFPDSELGDPCGEQPDLDMAEQENTLEESTEGSGEFSELKQMLVQQRNCAGTLRAGEAGSGCHRGPASRAGSAWMETYWETALSVGLAWVCCPLNEASLRLYIYI